MATTEKGSERLTQFLGHVNGDPGGGIASLQGTGTFWSTPPIGIRGIAILISRIAGKSGDA